MHSFLGNVAVGLIVACSCLGAAQTVAPEATVASQSHDHDWPVYGGTLESTHYSPLSQINRSNVATLKVAWMYDSGEAGGLQTNPIIVEGVLYAYTPTQKVIALDAASGKLLWKFDSGINGTQPVRGLSYWTDGKEKRILAGVMNFMYALDARTGQPIPSFGEKGRIDLREGLGREPQEQSFAVTTPAVVYKDLFIVGGREPETLPAPPGDIRAYDVRSGKMRWIFHTIPHPGEVGYETWPKDGWKTSGAANNWAGMSVDIKRGIIYVPTGSAAFDFYGADRVGDDLFANSLLALDAETGRRIWHFQAVKHDIWDRDFPSPPISAYGAARRESRSMPWLSRRSRGGCICSIGRMANRCFRLSITPIRLVMFQERWLRKLSRYHRSRRLLRGNGSRKICSRIGRRKRTSGRSSNSESFGAMGSLFLSA